MNRNPFFLWVHTIKKPANAGYEMITVNIKNRVRTGT